MINPYTYGTIALLMTVGNYYRMHDKYISNRDTMIKKIEEQKMKEQKEREEAEHVKKNMRVVCNYYLENDMVHGYRLQPENITDIHCTHLLVGYATLDPDTLTLTVQDLDDWKRLKKLLDLKTKHADMKVILAIGAGPGGAMTKMISSWFFRYRFIYSVLDLFEDYHFDGLDFDWEFPGFHEGKTTDRQWFPVLLEELKTTFKEKEKPIILSATVAALPPLLVKSYDIKKMAKHLDFINLMSYDYYYYQTSWSYTAHHSPLFSRLGAKGDELSRNVAWSVDNWVILGMPKAKINIGVTTYARTYTLKYNNQFHVMSPAKGPGLGQGLLDYSGVCDFLKKGAKSLLDSYGQVPFAFRDSDWISYEDPYSVTVKAVWAKEIGCGGVMAFSLNTDDWEGKCDGKYKFPLHRAIWRALKKGY